MSIMKNHHHPHYHTSKLGASVGLAIVAALDIKPSSEILINHKVLSNPPSPRSDPVPVITNNNNNNYYYSGSRIRNPHYDNVNEEEDEDENFTYVTCRGATSSVTRVYHHRPTATGVDCCIITSPKFFMHSKMEDNTKKNCNNTNSNDCSNFLSSCDMCRKTLAGKDIYMYRGEKAFCSEECRQRQIASDERKEKICRRASKTTSSVSRSQGYYETGQIFSTGIIATY